MHSLFLFLGSFIDPICKKRWCRDCIDLLIKTTFTDPTDSKADFDEENGKLREKLKPRFGWMKTLESLVILGDRLFQDYFTHEFLDWVRELQGGRFLLKRLWITEEEYSPSNLGPQNMFLYAELMNGPTVKSFAMPYGYWNGHFNELKDERFSTLEHLARIEFYEQVERFENLTELKYIRGECYVEVI